MAANLTPEEQAHFKSLYLEKLHIDQKLAPLQKKLDKANLELQVYKHETHRLASEIDKIRSEYNYIRLKNQIVDLQHRGARVEMAVPVKVSRFPRISTFFKRFFH